MAEFNMDGMEAPENKPKEYLKPGYRKLTIKSFEYTKEEAGKTPLIVMKAVSTNADGEELSFMERFYLSGKLDKNGVMSSVVRLQELYKGLTGNPKMGLKPSAYNYTTTDDKGNSVSYTIPSPADLCEYLKTTCVGLSGIFKVGADVTEDNRMFVKLVYSGFLYYTDRSNNLVKYTKEGDFNDSDYKYAVQKKAAGKPSPAAASNDSKSLLDSLV